MKTFIDQDGFTYQEKEEHSLFVAVIEIGLGNFAGTLIKSPNEDEAREAVEKSAAMRYGTVVYFNSIAGMIATGLDLMSHGIKETNVLLN